MTTKIKTCALMLLCVLATAPATAMYRCGNAFQDRPCDPGTVGTRLAPPGRAVAPPPVMTAPATASNSPAAAACDEAAQSARQNAPQPVGATQDNQGAIPPANAGRGKSVKIIGLTHLSSTRGMEIKIGRDPGCLPEKPKGP